MSFCNFFTQFNNGFMSAAGFRLGLGLSNFVNNAVFGYNSVPFNFCGSFYNYPSPNIGFFGIFGQYPSMDLYTNAFQNTNTFNYNSNNASLWDQIPAQSINYNNVSGTNIWNNSDSQGFKWNSYSFDSFTPSFTTTGSNSTTKKSSTSGVSRPTTTGTLQRQMIDKAMAFNGQGPSAVERGLGISFNGNQWCSAFASQLAINYYGDKLPWLKQPIYSSNIFAIKAQENGRYMAIQGNTTAEKNAWIAKNVRPGDIMVMSTESKPTHGATGHIGIVTEVDTKNGTFKIVEGNWANKVHVSKSLDSTHTEIHGTKSIIGFIKLSDLS